nr:hypothetical protein BOSE7B_60232 [Bosea sp. 7B]
MSGMRGHRTKRSIHNSHRPFQEMGAAAALLRQQVLPQQLASLPTASRPGATIIVLH